HYAGKLDLQAHDWISRTAGGAKRMRNLLDSITHYASVLPRDKVLQPVDCGSAVQDACANLQAALQEGAAELVVGDLPTVLGNREQLLFLFQNLIGNAVKFRLADRCVRVEGGSRRHEDGWPRWVRDNCIGIEAQHLQKLFVKLGVEARFYTDRNYAGTGFGLNICQKIVLGHGGRIWVESEPGQGSTFYFTLTMPTEREAR